MFTCKPFIIGLPRFSSGGRERLDPVGESVSVLVVTGAGVGFDVGKGTRVVCDCGIGVGVAGMSIAKQLNPREATPMAIPATDPALPLVFNLKNRPVKANTMVTMNTTRANSHRKTKRIPLSPLAFLTPTALTILSTAVGTAVSKIPFRKSFITFLPAFALCRGTET